MGADVLLLVAFVAVRGTRLLAGPHRTQVGFDAGTEAALTLTTQARRLGKSRICEADDFRHHTGTGIHRN